jgi:hypothetical protein
LLYLALLQFIAGAAWLFWPLAVSAVLFLGVCGALWWRGTQRAAQVLAVFHAMARELGLVRCAGMLGLREEALNSATEKDSAEAGVRNADTPLEISTDEMCKAAAPFSPLQAAKDVP